MLYYIKGTIVEVGTDSVILDNHGIGFEIHTTGRVLQDLVRQGTDEVLLYTHLQILENERVLYGFPDKSDIRVFRQLISVSGVGPKAALAILNILTVEELYYAVQSGDSKAISKAQGVGAKIAQRVIVDLKGVLQPGSADPDMDGFSGNMEENVISETAEALTSLGYSNMDALRAIRKVEGAESMTVEQLLSAALRKL